MRGCSAEPLVCALNKYIINKSRGDTEEDITLKLVFDYTKEYKEMNKIILVLGVIESAQRKRGVTSNTLSLTSSTPATPIKISKPDPIKFNRQQRDFAPFKYEFEAIVIPRMYASNIDFHLKRSM